MINCSVYFVRFFDGERWVLFLSWDGYCTKLGHVHSGRRLLHRHGVGEQQGGADQLRLGFAIAVLDFTH